MKTLPNMLRTRGVALGAFAILIGMAACAEQQPSGSLGDLDSPGLVLAPLDAPNDSSIAFTATAVDNLGIKSIRILISGGITGVIDTNFTVNQTRVTVPYTLAIPTTVQPGTAIILIGTATDGARNVSAPDTLTLTVGGVAPPTVRIVSPTAADAAVVGRQVLITITGSSELKIRSLGYIATGAVTGVDSVVYSNPLLVDRTSIDTLTIPAGATPGPLTLQPFLVDSLGRQRFLGSPVTLQVIPAAGAGTRPVVDFGLNERIEVTDTIFVTANDPAGISMLGYDVRLLDGTVVGQDSITSSGQITSLRNTFTMRLNVTTFPTRVLVRAWARNSAGTSDTARVGGVVRVDTVTVVAGSTRPLPVGGLVADGLYHQASDKLYLSNITRNQLEVFYLGDSTFKAPVRVGSRPWGIAAWPRDRGDVAVPRLGQGDTILVANNGGTSISYVRVNPADPNDSGLEVYRYPLPNIILYTITAKLSENTGQLLQVRTRYDFSDRPQWLGAVCKGATTANSPCTEVVAVYSTSPTLGQNTPFDKNNGTLRWENLTTRQSHYFWQQANGQGDRRADTLEVERFGSMDASGNIVGHADSLLVPFLQVGTHYLTGDTALVANVVRIPELAFRDTTFVRNSGNFRRAIMGEGGRVLGDDITRNARAIGYDATIGMKRSNYSHQGYVLPTPVADSGISRAMDVTDYVANTSARVLGVSINFDGQISAFRADSVYLIDPLLRLQGVLEVNGTNPGFDFHPLNFGGGDPSVPGSVLPTERLAFSASLQPEIEVYDTWEYRRVGCVPVRDPIIGPIKASVRNGQVVLVGATARGVIIVALGNLLTASCQVP
ncbi:MAG TPA: hypothetical protein VJ650_00925 [Gemmatimonadaceae bacterium]|nr:hypothetical protein [Gemmatimonadaceae bacterium]